ncbi:hypothetical protein DPEC_G00036860 [Dallia pectoralis]|uniref:Uncharacterized protein n=1 Tax=Dallia pectoralis TaxID=75939 RepID=A0ACC2HDR5_DALPE|nr:hypothetical protein DPEC_G00036860 [Dallia pectoralis]
MEPASIYALSNPPPPLPLLVESVLTPALHLLVLCGGGGPPYVICHSQGMDAVGGPRVPSMGPGQGIGNWASSSCHTAGEHINPRVAVDGGVGGGES